MLNKLFVSIRSIAMIVPLMLGLSTAAFAQDVTVTAGQVLNINAPRTGTVTIESGGTVAGSYWLINGAIVVEPGGILTWDASVLSPADLPPAAGTILVGPPSAVAPFDSLAYITLGSAVGNKLTITADGANIKSFVLDGDADISPIQDATNNWNPFVLNANTTFTVNVGGGLEVHPNPVANGITMNLVGAGSRLIIEGDMIVQDGARVVLGNGAMIDAAPTNVHNTQTNAGTGIVNLLWIEIAPNLANPNFLGREIYNGTPYEIALTPVGNHTFAPLTVGYAAVVNHTVTVHNTGNTDTGAVSFTLVGPGAGSFELGWAGTPNITAGSSAAFTVRPALGLVVGTYTATVEVASNVAPPRFATESFNVSVTVNPAVLTAPTITVQPLPANVFSGGTASFTVAATGNPAPGFQWQISTNGGATWADVANGGIYSGATTATLTLTGVGLGDNGHRFRCVASNGEVPDATSNAALLTVNPAPAAALTHNVVANLHTFAPRTVGYGATAINPLTVTVSNTGNAPSGVLAVSIPAGAGFMITSDSVSGSPLTAGTSNTFQIAPNVGLAQGTHTATVTIADTNSGDTITFSVSFTVNAAPHTSSTASIPVLGPVGLVLLALALGGLAFRQRRRNV